MSVHKAHQAPSTSLSDPELSALRAEARLWAESDPDQHTKALTLALVDSDEPADIARLQERFRGRLSFGTAGLRGPVDLGPNAMSAALVRRVSLALGLHIKAQVNVPSDAPDEPLRVVIGYDARHGSQAFADEATRALAGLGFEVHLSPTLCPTPLLAHAVKHLGAVAGVMVTASHNPPQDNGFKVYWGNGAQIIPPHDTQISALIDEVGDGTQHPRPTFEELHKAQRLVTLSAAQGDAYERDLLATRFGTVETSADLKITYTAMHGVGCAWFERVMYAAGFEHISLVQEQVTPNPDFPTVAFPNPEEPGALDLALATAEAKGSDLILAHDPDADRLAVVARNAEGDLKPFTGDQLGALIAHELFEQRAARGLPLSTQQMVATTIVSSSLLGVMAERVGVRFVETLTGFKWIANAALEHELAHQSDQGEFLFGYEEAIGYSVGSLVRDKDGVSAALFVADMAARAQAEGLTLWGRLEEIYRRYGVFVSAQVNRVCPGAEGATQIQQWMKTLREHPPTHIADLEVCRFTDLTRAPEPLTGNVLHYSLEGQARVIVRPSGTEPKIKVYLEACASPEGRSLDEAFASANATLERLKRAVEGLLS